MQAQKQWRGLNHGAWHALCVHALGGVLATPPSFTHCVRSDCGSKTPSSAAHARSAHMLAGIIR